jgi:hypothetical protein
MSMNRSMIKDVLAMIGACWLAWEAFNRLVAMAFCICLA